MLTTTRMKMIVSPMEKLGKVYKLRCQNIQENTSRMLRLYQDYSRINNSTWKQINRLRFFVRKVFYERNKNYADFKNYLQLVRELNDCFSNSIKERSKSVSDFSKDL